MSKYSCLHCAKHSKSTSCKKNVWPGLVEGILCLYHSCTTFKSRGIVLRLLVEGGRVKLPNHDHRHQVLPGPASRWTLRGNSYRAVAKLEIRTSAKVFLSEFDLGLMPYFRSLTWKALPISLDGVDCTNLRCSLR